jgi:hypothetical protein
VVAATQPKPEVHHAEPEPEFAEAPIEHPSKPAVPAAPARVVESPKEAPVFAAPPIGKVEEKEQKQSAALPGGKFPRAPRLSAEPPTPARRAVALQTEAPRTVDEKWPRLPRLEAATETSATGIVEAKRQMPAQQEPLSPPPIAEPQEAKSTPEPSRPVREIAPAASVRMDHPAPAPQRQAPTPSAPPPGLTIQRLDVQIVERPRAELDQLAQYAAPAPAQTAPWDLPDRRHHLRIG